MKFTIWCLTLSILLLKIDAYFYEHNLKSLSSNARSMFGYGIAYQHTVSNKNFLVSAPTADQIGQIFKCSLNNYTCNKMTIDVTGKRETTENEKEVTYNHNFLLGASLASDSNYAVTCAPRITNDFNYYKNGKQYKIFGTFGKCYSLEDNSDHFVAMYSVDSGQTVKETTLAERIMDGYGWSAHISKIQQVFIGGPPMGKGRVLYYSSIKDQNPNLMYPTNEKTAYNYGYSITSGNFLSKNKNHIFLAISTPYDTIGYGKIKLYSIVKQRIVETHKEISDDAVSSIFGATMCAADLDGDGIDDLLVGVPAYQKLEAHLWNIGAVYIYLEKLNKKKLLTGYVSEGYFGSSIVNIGDQDGDGCDDICIGAPYEDRGVVYVYSGAVISKEKDIKWTQRIEAKGGISFGLSLTPLPNFENNGCSGLGVGAPESDSVYIVHCIPMVTLTLKTIIPNVHLIPVNTTSFDIKSCFNIKYSKKLQNVIGDVVVKTKVDHEKAAIAYPNVNGTDGSYFQYETSLKIDKNEYCTNVTVTIPMNGDYSQLLKYIIKVELKEKATNFDPYNPFRVLLSPRSTLSDEGKISAARGCSNENCVSILDIKIHHDMPDYYMLGSTETEYITVSVMSSGETSYSSCVRINIVGVSVLKYPAYCVKDQNNETILICSPITPLFNEDIWFTGYIILDMKTLTSAHKDIKLIADLYYNCKMEKNTTSENIIHLVTNTSGVEIKSTSSFDPVIKIWSSDFQIERKPVEHSFMITNHGIVTWEGLQANLSLEHDKYFICTGVKIDNVVCEVPSHLEEGRFNLACPLPILNANSTKLISIQMDILAKNLENQLNDRNITLETTLNVAFDGINMNTSVSNVLVYQGAGAVPFWIIIISSIIGLAVLLAIGFGMSEAGFFKRQNKEKLETLKQEVKRQSVIRQSVILEAKQSLKPATPFYPISED